VGDPARGIPRRSRSWAPPTRARLLAQARSIVPDVLAAVRCGAGPEAPMSWSVQAMQITTTRATVVVLGVAGGPPAAVLKLPHTASGVAGARHERDALEALHADDRLARLRRLVPRPLAAGEVRGQYYALTAALPGVSALALLPEPASAERVARLAAEATRELHRRTASTLVAGDHLLRLWVDEPVAVLRRLARPPGWLPMGRGLDRLSDRLRNALAGRELCTGRIHGDLWLGNLLVSPDGTELTGIVDWDRTAAAQLLSQDLLHLVLYTRRLVRRSELGELVGEVLQGDPWSSRERALLESGGGHACTGAVEPSVETLLYWLWHTAAHVRTQPMRSPRLSVWGRRNVMPVLRLL